MRDSRMGVCIWGKMIDLRVRRRRAGRRGGLRLKLCLLGMEGRQDVGVLALRGGNVS